MRFAPDTIPGMGAKWFVWSVWAAMVAAAAGYVVRFGSDVPYWDDWNMVDVVTGAQPVTFQWLWTSYGGHRIPLPRLVLLALYKISGADFRSGMYFNVALLAGTSAVLIWASGRMRGGKVSAADAVFPLLLLHWGHFENLLWSWQVGFVLAVAMTGMALAIIAAYGLAPIPKVGVILASLVVVLLPISDVPGLVYAPALAAWIAATGVVAYRDHRRGYAALLWAGALLTWALVIVYFQGYSHKPLAMSVTQWRTVLLTALGFVAGGLGPVGRQLWPPILRALPAAVLLTTFAATGWAVARSNQPPFRSRAMLLFFIGAACLVAALCLGRPGTPAWVGRYFLLGALIWCAAFLAWPLCFKPRVAWMAQVAMLPLLIGIAPWNFHEGLLYGRDYHSRMEQFRTDLLSGMSPGQLVARHVVSLDPCPFSGYPDIGVQFRWGNLIRISKSFPITGAVSFHDWIADKLRKLHAAKIGDYARMQPDESPLREIIPSPTSGFAVTRATGRNDSTAPDETAVLLTPDRPLYVAGIRIRRPVDLGSSSPTDVHVDEGDRPTDADPAWTQVFWRLPNESAYMVPHRYLFVWENGKNEQTVWIFGTINQFGFHIGDHDIQRQLNPDHLPVTVLVPVESYVR